MPVTADFACVRYEDCVLLVNLTPPVPIGGWGLRFQLHKRLGGQSGLVDKYESSGYNGVSGIAVTNSGLGVFSVTLDSADTSGRDFGAYPYQITRTDSGHVTVLTEGYLLLNPSIG